MSLDNTILARARAALSEQNRKREEQLLSRRTAIYRRVPEIAATDARLRQLMGELLEVTLTGGPDVEQKVDAIGRRSLQLQQQRRELLKQAGFPRSYLDDDPACPDCGDSGFIKGRPCECLMELYREGQAKELSSLCHLQGESFDTFRLHWYSDVPDQNGKTARAHMRAVYDYYRIYAENFGEKTGNLLFTGGPGLGKTFLSACIARTVSGAGFSVMYQRAGEVFSAFENARFSRGERQEEAEASIKRFCLCDLLILDDLGTEMTNSVTVAALYELVNSRLTGGKKTIISTNLTEAELGSRYSLQIASRISGEYEILRFTGEDIRLLKKRARYEESGQ